MIKERREKLASHMSQNSVLLLFAGDLIKKSADSHYPFEVNRNFYYMTQCDEDGLIYLRLKNKQAEREVLFIKDIDPFMEKWVGRSYRKEEVKALAEIEQVYYLSEFEDMFRRILNMNQIETIYVDSERQSKDEIENTAERWMKSFKEVYPAVQFKNLNQTINRFRMIKSDEELECIRKAIEITGEGLEAILSVLKPGETEYGLAAAFRHVCLKHHEDLAFDTIAASGSDANILHYVSNQKKLQDGDLVLLDLGSTYRKYNGDISRTYPVSGKFTERQKELYNIVLQGQKKVFEAIKPGVSTVALNNVLIEHYAEACVKAGVIENKDQVSEIYYHSIGHNLGLDVHDVGALEGEVLKAGMVYTVEPGLYSAKEGIGIRIEDDVLVTEDGYINLSSSIPKTVEEIEALMNK